MASLKFHSACYAVKRATVSRKWNLFLNYHLNGLRTSCCQSFSAGSAYNACDISGPNPYPLGGRTLILIEPRSQKFHTSVVLIKDDKSKKQNQPIKDKTLLSKTPSEQVEELKKGWREARELLGVENVQWQSLQEDLNNALRNLDPVAHQTDEILRQNLADLTQEFVFHKVSVQRFLVELTLKRDC